MPKWIDKCPRAEHCDSPDKSGCGEDKGRDGKWRFVHNPNHDKGCHMACKKAT